MPDTTLKIRVDSSDLERWRHVAGYRGVSQWIRGLCVAEILRLEREHGPISRITSLADPPVAHAMPPARLMPADVEPTPAEAEKKISVPMPCRHGIQNCRICQIGVYAP